MQSMFCLNGNRTCSPLCLLLLQLCHCHVHLPAAIHLSLRLRLLNTAGDNTNFLPILVYMK